MARSDVVGSLLRPAYLREARQGVREGRVSEAELHAAEVLPRLSHVDRLPHSRPTLSIPRATCDDASRQGWRDVQAGGGVQAALTPPCDDAASGMG
jgi:hypothetical protein